MYFVQKMLSDTAGILNNLSLEKQKEIKDQPFLNRCCLLQYISQPQSCLLLTIKLLLLFIYSYS